MQEPTLPHNPIDSKSLEWNDVFSDDPLPEQETGDRQLFRACLGTVSSAAKVKLPDCESRINKAVAILLNRDLVASEPVHDTEGQITCRFDVGASQDVTSHLVTHSDPDGWCCSCADSEHKAPQGLCKHKLASMMWLKTHALMQERRGQQTSNNGAAIDRGHADGPLPEARASANVHVEINGRKVQLTIRDTCEDKLLSRLTRLLDRFPPLTPTPPPTDIASSIPDDPQPDPTWCGIHQCAMDEHENERGTWFSHWLPETEKWCKGKGRGRR